jgi:hypothetical protein
MTVEMVLPANMVEVGAVEADIEDEVLVLVVVVFV